MRTGTAWRCRRIARDDCPNLSAHSQGRRDGCARIVRACRRGMAGVATLPDVLAVAAPVGGSGARDGVGTSARLPLAATRPAWADGTAGHCRRIPRDVARTVEPVAADRDGANGRRTCRRRAEDRGTDGRRTHCPNVPTLPPAVATGRDRGGVGTPARLRPCRDTSGGRAARRGVCGAFPATLPEPLRLSAGDGSGRGAVARACRLALPVTVAELLNLSADRRTGTANLSRHGAAHSQGRRRIGRTIARTCRHTHRDGAPVGVTLPDVLAIARTCRGWRTHGDGRRITGRRGRTANLSA